jgi:hypothetical protein
MTNPELELFLKECKPTDRFDIGYYDIELMEYVISVLKERGYKPSFYGEMCTMVIFNQK